MRIKELIKRQGYTQKTFAEKLGISLSALNQRIDGNPSLSSLREIAFALDVSISELFDDDKEESNTIKCPNCGEQINITVAESKV